MVISDAERKVLLERLEKARKAKIAKREAALAEKQAAEKPKEAEQPKTPVVEPQSEPPKEELPPPNLLAKVEEEEIKLPPKIKKAKAKKVVQSDEESEAEEPVKKPTKGKKQAYMKIKIYKEPSNPTAFNNLIEALNETEAEEQVTIPAPVPTQTAPVKSLRGATAKEQQSKPLNTARALALSFFN